MPNQHKLGQSAINCVASFMKLNKLKKLNGSMRGSDLYSTLKYAKVMCSVALDLCTLLERKPGSKELIKNLYRSFRQLRFWT